jgi:hypothetical protein
MREQQGKIRRLAQREKNAIALNFVKLRDKVEQNSDVIKQDNLFELP